MSWLLFVFIELDVGLNTLLHVLISAKTCLNHGLMLIDLY